MRAEIDGFMRKQQEVINKGVKNGHLIFDLISTTYVETYVIPTKWLKPPPESHCTPWLLPKQTILKTYRFLYLINFFNILCKGNVFYHSMN